MVTIFYEVDRTDTSPKKNGEGEFEFHNRSARPEFDKVRSFLDDLISEYPESDQGELVARLRSGSDEEFRSASFELILHGIVNRLGGKIDCHPQVPNSDGRPDFKVTLPDGNYFYLEASCTTSGSTDPGAEARKGVVFDNLNRTKNSEFFLDVRSTGAPATPPKGTKLRKRLETWLALLDAEAIKKAIEEHGYDAAPELPWEHEGWTLVFKAAPKNKPKESERAIGTYMEGAHPIDDWSPIRDRVMAKGNRYGELDAPLIVAINSSAFNLDKIDVMQALFGQEEFVLAGGKTEMRRKPNGAWQDHEGPRYTRISGVWVFNDLKPSNTASRKHAIYVNPDAQCAVPEFLLDIPSHRPADGKLIAHDGLCVRCILDMAASWPED